MLPNLRNHSGVLLYLFGAATVFAGLIFGCEAFNKTNSLLTPGAKVNESQLQGEVAQKQAAISKLQNAIATTQKSAATDYQKAIVAAQQKYADQLQAADQQTADLNADADAFNKQVASAEQDLQNRQQTLNNVVNVLGGIVATAAKGTFDPMSLVTTIPMLAVTALGLGAVADKKQLQSVVVAQRQQAANNAGSGSVPDPGGAVAQGTALPAGSNPTPYILPVGGTNPPLKQAA